MCKYICFGLQSFWEKEDIPGSPQGSPQHRGDEDDEALDGYPGLLFTGSYALGEEKVFEVRTEPLLHSRALWRGAGKAGANGAGADGGLPRRGGC